VLCCTFIFTLRAKLSGAVYCYRSRLWVRVCVCVFVCLRVCYQDNSKLRSSILTKLGLLVKVVTISGWLNFAPPPERESAAGRNLGLPNNFWTKRAIRFKFGIDIEDGASLRMDHKTIPKWAWPGPRDLIS